MRLNISESENENGHMPLVEHHSDEPSKEAIVLQNDDAGNVGSMKDELNASVTDKLNIETDTDSLSQGVRSDSEDDSTGSESDEEHSQDEEQDASNSGTLDKEKGTKQKQVKKRHSGKGGSKARKKQKQKRKAAKLRQGNNQTSAFDDDHKKANKPVIGSRDGKEEIPEEKHVEKPVFGMDLRSSSKVEIHSDTTKGNVSEVPSFFNVKNTNQSSTTTESSQVQPVGNQNEDEKVAKNEHNKKVC
ncbi:hypothetical protein DPMN_054202 [Dreissena polymorpha]|uniref:Uncharacterized protein n=1 Tax=Dreissena polymorpha TaxID=45954 RepID=A0A9D4CP80_DREPO|nr:hypothetical protein DPMN_054202 [Dreissena polymorpha]